MNFVKQNILVTGATGYLGRAMCVGLAKQGADIAVCSTSQSRADSLAIELNQTFGIKGIGYQLNLQEIDRITDVIF